MDGCNCDGGLNDKSFRFLYSFDCVAPAERLSARTQPRAWRRCFLLAAKSVKSHYLYRLTCNKFVSLDWRFNLGRAFISTVIKMKLWTGNIEKQSSNGDNPFNRIDSTDASDSLTSLNHDGPTYEIAALAMVVDRKLIWIFCRHVSKIIRWPVFTMRPSDGGQLSGGARDPPTFGYYHFFFLSFVYMYGTVARVTVFAAVNKQWLPDNRSSSN